MVIKVSESHLIKLQIWDTCGQEAYRSLVSNFFRNSTLTVLTYAVNDKGSFDNMSKWLEELRNKANLDAKIILVGNKKDLEKREVSFEEGVKFTEQDKLNFFLETSAKSGENAQELFVEAAKILYGFHRESVHSKRLKSMSNLKAPNDKMNEDNNSFRLSKSNLNIKRNFVDRDFARDKSCSC